MPKSPSNVVDLLSFRQGPGGSVHAAEGLALVKAFLRIEDASLRQAIIQLVERIAAGECKG